MGRTKKDQAQAKDQKARESATGTTPTPEMLGEGTRLEYPFKGTTHRAVVVKDGDNFLLKMGLETFRSLSQAAGKVAGHAARGGICWRREGESQPLLGRPKYGAAAAGASAAPPEPEAAKAPKKVTPKRAPRIRKGDGKNGTVKITKGVKCGMKGCSWRGPQAGAAAHAATHPAS